MLQQIVKEITESLPSLVKAVFSAPRGSDLPRRIVLEKGEKMGESLFFVEETRENKAFHRNLTEDEALSFLRETVEACAFRQINLFTSEKEIAFRISKKGKVSRSVNTLSVPVTVKASHNKEKNYLIREGEAVPFLVDLGVFTREYKVVHAKYDKFRQINRFIEILDHAFSDFDKDEVRVLDFGCGKSYLTFFVYYYFSHIRKKRVHIIGYDLKADVVAHCNELAKKYGYHGLSFVVADVTRDTLSSDPIDFVISLHACDVATDFALNFALERDVPYIFSVPCCQHEIGQKIGKGEGDLDLFLEHGLFKERLCALLTDAMRTKILEAEGYRVEVLEFVDFAHSPKNIMLRAKRTGHKKKSLAPLFELEARYGFTQTLLHLREEKQ
ncbi:MAG: SAM-dependent methyltransferase [Clostridia bacterium]|nr:SAM-dependent methyltransferase [Clostridia bacterium]